MKSEMLRDGKADTQVVAKPRRNQTGTAENVIRLDACSELDWIVVRTRGHVYELIVLDGPKGDVVVRGGSVFPEFRRGTLAGSTFGGSAVKQRCVCAGLRLELHVDGKCVVTSQIQGASRCQLRMPVARA